MPPRPCSTAVFGRLLLNFSLTIVLLLGLAGAAAAQSDVRQRLDRQRAELAQIESGVSQPDVPDAALQTLRTRIDPVVDVLREVVAEQTPRFEGVRSRLEQLGPRPDAAKGETESPDITRQRTEQEAALKDVEETLRVARLLDVQADQLIAAIGDKRRAILTKALLERSSSVLSPILWFDLARALPQELTAFQLVMNDWFRIIADSMDQTKLAILGLVVIATLALAVPGRRYLRRFAGRHPDSEPSRLVRALTALKVTLIWAAVPLAISFGLYSILESLGFLPPRIAPTVKTLLTGFAFVAFAHGLADGVLAPDQRNWRVFAVDDESARRLTWLAVTFTGVVFAGKTMEELYQAIVAALPVTVASKGLFDILAALVIMHAIRQLAGAAEDGGEPAATPAPVTSALPVRLLGWVVAGLILGAALTGYVALGAFLVDQVMWVVTIGVVLTIVLILVDEVVGHGLSAEGRAGREIMAQVGLRRGSLQQISILAAGFLRLILIIVATLLVLAPWGLDGVDVVGTLRAAVFGFTVGGVTISMSTIVVSIALFVVGFTVTRSIQRWLSKSYLPHTSLDPGLRNSISTILGYVGIIVAAMIALSQLGLSLDKLTIVAGALSVGIGFGLQSIVNNFVSGLILLWERPLRVGDWIDIGSEQGIVKRINVRSTEIETFDRASLIVPNAEFISGRVKNWMHNDRLGRIVIPVGVAYSADPQAVKKILTDVALSHREVLTEPPARVFFMRLGPTSLEFELRCFVDVDSMLSVKSQLLFDLFRSLREARIDIPAPEMTVKLLPNPGAESEAVPETPAMSGQSTGGQAAERPRAAAKA